MIRIPFWFARRALGDVRSRALLFGALFGAVATELSKVPERATYNLAMAVIVIVAGSTSFVLHALHAQREAAPRGWSVRAADVRAWICLLGSGVALTITGLRWLGG